MVENEKLNSAELEEYNEIISGIKEEYKKKITQEIQTAKKNLAKEALLLLGQNFIDLFNERKKLLAEYGEKARDILRFAVNNNMVEEVERLNTWSANLDKNTRLTGEGNKLFMQLVDKIEVYSPDIAKPLKDCEQKLFSNNEKMNKIVAAKKDLLKGIENNHREKLKKIIVDLIIEFNKKVVVINQSFGIINPEPHIIDHNFKDISISLSESEDEEIFISSGNSDIIN